MHYTDKILVIADGSVQQKPVSESTISEAVSETPEIKSHFEAEVFSSQRTEKATEVSEEVSKTNELDDLTRATGDLAVYRYYFRCVGWPNTALFVGLIALNVFCNSFSREFSIFFIYYLLDIAVIMIMSRGLLTILQMYGSSGGQILAVGRLRSTWLYISAWLSYPF